MEAALGRAQREDRLAILAESIREAAWDIALGVIEDGLGDEAVPSLGRVSELERLGHIPAFVGELGRHVADPSPGRIRPGSRLIEVARNHARQRERLGFAEREVVTELLLLRRALWRFVAGRRSLLATDDLLVAEHRLDDLVDTLVVECVAAYFAHATAELSDRARRDALTGLLNQQAFWNDLEHELERAQRFGHGLSLVVVDLDYFKEINDTHGHPVGDRVLRSVAAALGGTLRRSDLAGRLGGDEFGVALVESEPAAAEAYIVRARAALETRGKADDLRVRVQFSAGSAHFPSQGSTPAELFELADAHLYEGKRSR